MFQKQKLFRSLSVTCPKVWDPELRPLSSGLGGLVFGVYGLGLGFGV